MTDSREGAPLRIGPDRKAAGAGGLSVALITGLYGEKVRETPLANELSAALVAAGHRLHVIAVQWSEPVGGGTSTVAETDGVVVTRIAPTAVMGAGRLVWRITKWTLTPLLSHLAARRAMRDQRFDVVVGFSPAVALSGAFLAALPRARRSLLYVTDFFPFHHRSLGMVPAGPVFEIARRLESALFRRFGTVACMSQAGVDYLRAHYPVKATQKTVAIPLWSAVRPRSAPDRAAVRARHGLPLDRPIALFGGQIAEGRGIDEILQAARLAADADSRLFFAFVGRGPLEGLVRDEIAEGRGNLALVPALPREDYLEVVGACDIGIVCTVRGVDVPTFPSKTLDYLQAGLPVVASVEASTDYGAFIESAGFGRAGLAGDPSVLLANLEAVAGAPETARAMGEAARRALGEVFDVNRAVERLLAAAS